MDEGKSMKKEVSGSNNAEESVRNRTSKSKVPLPRRESICKEITPRIVIELSDESSDTSDDCIQKKDEYVLNSDMPMHKKLLNSTSSDFLRLFDKVTKKNVRGEVCKIGNSFPTQLNLIPGLIGQDKGILNPFERSKASSPQKNSEAANSARRQRRCVSANVVCQLCESGQQQRTKRAGSLDPVCRSNSTNCKSPHKKGGRKPSLLQSPNKSGPLSNSECPEVSPQSKGKKRKTCADPASSIEFHSEHKRGGSQKSKQEFSKCKRKKKQDLTDKSRLLKGAGEVNQNTRKHLTMPPFVENNGVANKTVNQNPESLLFPQGPSISELNQNHALSLSNDPMRNCYTDNVRIINNEIYGVPPLGPNAKPQIDYTSQTHYVAFPTGIPLSLQTISNSNQLLIQPQVQSLLPYSPQSTLSNVYSPMSQSSSPAFPSQNYIFNQNMPSAISTPNMIPVVFTPQNSPVLTSSNVLPSLIPAFSSSNSTVMNNPSAQSSLNPNLISVFDSLNSAVARNPSALPLLNPGLLSNTHLTVLQQQKFTKINIFLCKETILQARSNQ